MSVPNIRFRKILNFVEKHIYINVTSFTSTNNFSNDRQYDPVTSLTQFTELGIFFSIYYESKI